MDVHFAMIDEFNECIEIREGDILQHDHGMLAWCALNFGERERKLSNVKYFISFTASN